MAFEVTPTGHVNDRVRERRPQILENIWAFKPHVLMFHRLFLVIYPHARSIFDPRSALHRKSG